MSENWRKEIVNILKEVSEDEDVTDEERRGMIVQKIKEMLQQYPQTEVTKIILDITKSWFGSPIAEGCIRFLIDKISPPTLPVSGDYT